MTPPVTPDANESAGSRFLDALRNGDLDAAMALVPAGATLRVSGVDRTWTGPDQIGDLLTHGRGSHPGAAYQAQTRHLGRGAVIDDARLVGLLAGTRPGTSTDVPAQVTVRERDGAVATIHVEVPPIFLAALQGATIDPLELSVAQLAISLRAVDDPSLTTIQLAPPAPTTLPRPATAKHTAEQPRGSRRGLLIGALVVLLLLGGGAFAYTTVSKDTSPAPQSAPPSTTPSKTPKPSRTPKPTPTVTKTEKPTVTLSANLAFGSDSAELSTAAEQAIIALADQARQAKVTGTIEVAGYTDSVGSAAHGLTLSRKRADAVADVLRSALSGLDITVVSKGYGEADPVASNATAEGRAKNRRVEIFLPDQ